MPSYHELFLSSLANLARAVELRDAYTGEHSHRVSRFALLLGRQLELSGEDLEWLRLVTPLHDIGKIGIEDGILRKPGPLTSEEWNVMKTHPSKGAEILQHVPNLQPALPIVRSHHERWDGFGYPDGLAGEEIPRLARIVAAADALDVLVFDTPYHRGQSVETAFAEMQRHRGSQFDPEVVTALLQIHGQIVQEMDGFARNGTSTRPAGRSFSPPPTSAARP